jgi:hypothetical protein
LTSIVRQEIQSWVANRSTEEEMPLGTMCYRVMTMIAYLGDSTEAEEVHRNNDLGTAYAIGYTLGHLTIKANDGAVQYIIGAYNALLDYFTNKPAEENNGSTNQLHIQD